MAPLRVDPLFAGIAKAIYGDIDPRELLVKAMPDTSDVHVPQALPPGAPAMKPKDQKALAVTGLASTGVAGAAGVHAVKATLTDNLKRSAAAGDAAAAAKLAAQADKGSKLVRLLSKVPHVSPVNAAGIVGAGALGLHGVELLGDSLAAHAQVNAIRQANAAQKQQTPVSKAIRLRALNAGDGVVRRVPSLRARRPKATPLPAPPSSAAGLFQPVRKGVFGEVRRTVHNAQAISGHGVNAAADAAATARKVRRLVPTRTTAALIGAGAVGGLGAATGTGAYLGAKAGRQPVGKARDVVWTGEIAKVDTDKRQVFGWASVSQIGGEEVVDLQGDIVPIDEIEKAAYQYVLTSRKGGDMHRRVSKADEPLHTADMIESFVVTPEKLEKMGLAPDALPLGWWVGFHVNDDEQWHKVRSGERTGFSIHGQGVREPIGKAAPADKTLRAVWRTDATLRRIGQYPLGTLGAPSQRLVVRAMGRHGDNIVRARQGGHSTTKIIGAVDRRGNRMTTRATVSGALRGADLPEGARRGGTRADDTIEADAMHLARATRRNAALEPPGYVRRKGVLGKADTTLRERTEQALHPPPVKLHPVASSFIQSMGYQPQTRRLTYRMKSNPDKLYSYRVKPSAGVDALTAESKGRFFATRVRGKARPAKGPTVSDRMRLFADPQLSKAARAMPAPKVGAPPTSPTAQQVAAATAAPPAPPAPKVLQPLPSMPSKPAPIAPPAKPPMLGGKVSPP